jgi:hypothetical protein
MRAVSNTDEQEGSIMTQPATATTTIQAAARQLTGMRREQGVKAADRDYCTTPCAQWLDSLNAGRDQTSLETRQRLTAGMSVSLAIRDALILSTVDAGCSLDAMLDFAADPHAPRTARRMYHTLRTAFDDPLWAPDQRRVDTALDILDAMRRDLTQEHGEENYAVQPLAMSAYLRWWTEKPGACEKAMRALAIQPNTTLAAIVLTALDHDIKPAYLANRNN